MAMITPSAQLPLTKGNKSGSSPAVAAALELTDPLGSGPWLSLNAAQVFLFSGLWLSLCCVLFFFFFFARQPLLQSPALFYSPNESTITNTHVPPGRLYPDVLLPGRTQQT
eukprot:FR737161.1.p2 GENE.FR737161.1~~FR737161.1.p2  ORF type:complete len:111 (-),score=26.11 FR737161.1:412-744(-)